MEDMRIQMQFAESVGYTGFCLTEQHMQVEGIETTTNPLFWNFYIAQHTEKMRVGQLGMKLQQSTLFSWQKTLRCSITLLKGGCLRDFRAAILRDGLERLVSILASPPRSRISPKQSSVTDVRSWKIGTWLSHFGLRKRCL